MGQKVHPYGFRLGFNKTWRSRWYSDRDYAKLLHEDLALRADLKKRFMHAGVSKIETERAANKLKIDIYTSRPQREILVEELRIVAIRVPARTPGLVEAEPESVGVNLLAHVISCP